MKPRIRRTAAMLTGTAVSLIAFASVVPAQAQAAAGCETLRVSVNNSKGQRGGTVQATLCLTSAGTAYLHDGYYNYVQDHQADGVAARAYIKASNEGVSGPEGVDDTSTSGGTELDRWDSASSGNTSVRVYVCLGTTFPGNSGARCASAVT